MNHRKTSTTFISHLLFLTIAENTPSVLSELTSVNAVNSSNATCVINEKEVAIASIRENSFSHTTPALSPSWIKQFIVASVSEGDKEKITNAILRLAELDKNIASHLNLVFLIYRDLLYKFIPMRMLSL